MQDGVMAHERLSCAIFRHVLLQSDVVAQSSGRRIPAHRKKFVLRKLIVSTRGQVVIFTLLPSIMSSI
jgi:hypothetical protein